MFCERTALASGLLVLCLMMSTAYAAKLPENLAPKAKVTADSEYNESHLARWAIDGKIPDAQCKKDAREAWCVRGSDTKMTGEFTLIWKQPVKVAEILYFGRTGQIMEECFKDYEVYLDDAPKPAVRGAFKKIHGPQRIKLPKPATVSKIRLNFLNAYTTSHNPGASEIMVFGSPVSDRQLVEMSVPAEERTPEALALREELLSGHLGFRDIMLVKRHPMDISHVYVYHVEGYQPGGGLYVYTPDADGGQIPLHRRFVAKA